MMIHMHNTPMQFWANAINISCYTVNRIFLGQEQRKHPMNCRLGENLTLSIFRILVVSVIYLGMRKTLEILMLNLI